MSELYKLGQSDFLKGLIVFMFSSILNIVYQMWQTSGEIDFEKVLAVAITALLAYLSKNFATDADGKILGKVQP